MTDTSLAIDPLFAVRTLVATPDPNRVVYAAMHQDYSEGWVDVLPDVSEHAAGAVVLVRLLAGGRGHFGPLEHPQISFGVGHFPHSVMQQARTHRVGVSFDVQSGRYTGQRVVAAMQGVYSREDRGKDLRLCRQAAERYVELLDAGKAEEHARGILPFDIRQHFVVSFSMRALMHFLDLRGKADAQWEIQQLATLMLAEFKAWSPELAGWYEQHRHGKARLAP
jgi:thymidylate synthase (FAD)